MKLRFYIDARTGVPHIYNHDVNEWEVRDVLDEPMEVRGGDGNSIVVLGRTRNGRYLRVIYRRDERRMDTAFVITAYEPGPKAIRGLRRRRKKKS